MESPVENGTVGQLVGTLQEGRDRRGRMKEGEKGQIVETEAEKRIRELTGKGRG